jgi:hypothetical protein
MKEIYFTFIIFIITYYNIECNNHEGCLNHQIDNFLYCKSLSCDSFNGESEIEMKIQCDANSLRCAILNGVCSSNPCGGISTNDECLWGCKRREGKCVSDVCASHDVREGDESKCINDINNKCIYKNNRCEVDPCSLHEELSNCVSDIEKRCVYDGITCSQDSCETFLYDLNLCSFNPRCVVIGGECHENPCSDKSCDENMCKATQQTSCTLDLCISHKATNFDCERLDGCVVKTSGNNNYCVSGGCADLSESLSCGMNKKCVFRKNECTYDVCQGLSQNDCKKNILCYIDDSDVCAFDLCSEGSGMNDDGVICSSLRNCGYEEFDDTCKIATSTFTHINVGSIQGIV